MITVLHFNRLVLICLCLGCSTQSAVAVIIYGGTLGQNTTAPTGAFQDSGWQYEGTWQGAAGTAIAPHYFLTAAHLFGNIGDSFTMNGQSYTATAIFRDPNATDLEIVQVAQAFTNYAQLYRNTDELSGAGRVMAV